jgi:hypothetical protein
LVKNDRHVAPHGSEWDVKGENNRPTTSVHWTQAEAESAARTVAIRQRSEVVIQRPNEQIRDKNSYGNDPMPPKG